MLEFGSVLVHRCSTLFICCGLVACHKENAPEPAPKLSGKWKLEQEYRGNINYNPSGAVTSHYKYSRPGEPDEYLEIGDSTWVFLPSTSIYNGTKDGVYKLTDTTVVVKMKGTPIFTTSPNTNTYTFSALDAHRVIIREKNEFGTLTNYSKWVYTR
jgi:hypothetical protein